MLKSPRVQLVRLSASQIAAILSNTRESPSQRKLSSARAPEVIDPVTKPSKLCSPRNEQKRNQRDSTSAAPRVTEPVALKPLFPEEQNSQCEPMEITDSIPEPLPPMEQNPSVALTVIGAATSSERFQSPNQGEPSCTAAVNEAAALSGSSPLLSSQKPTCAAQMSPESEPSNVGQNLQQEPVARRGLSRPRKIRRVAKSREYDYNFRFYTDKVENYVCNVCFIFRSQNPGQKAAQC